MFFKVITTIAVTVAVFVLTASAQTPEPQGESDGIAIPLTKRSDADAPELLVTSHNANISREPLSTSAINDSEGNTGMPHHPSAVQRDEPGAGLDLTRFTSGIYYATIFIGTPPRSFTVQLNTAFSDLFVPAVTGDQNCRSHPDLWDPTSSLTINLGLNVDFMEGFLDGRYVTGAQYTDTVTIAGFTVEKQTIGAATTYSQGMEASMFAPDGMLGLAFPPGSQYHGRSPLLHTLFNEGKLSQPVFSLKLTESGGELYIGGTNRALYVQSTLVYTPVTSPALWQVQIDNIQVNGKIVVTNIVAVVDTAANYIYGDTQGVLAVHKAGGGRQYPFGDSYGYYYLLLCNDPPSVTFTIGGTPFLLPAKALNKGQVVYRSKNCFSGIAVAHANEAHNYWTLGTNFLEHFYTVFNFDSQSPRVGFAHLV